MTTETAAFIHQCPANTGFALLDSQIAYLLRPDLWASGQECACDFNPGKILNIQRVTRMVATIDGRRIQILTRCTNNLAGRIEEITGYQVEHLGQVEEVQRPALAPQRNNDLQRIEASGWRSCASWLLRSRPPTTAQRGRTSWPPGLNWNGWPPDLTCRQETEA